MASILRYDFELDRFQADAVDAISRGVSVLVAAPTGAGKTVIAEHALEAALQGGGRAVYANPIKALSNQKFKDLSNLFGSENVGLLTGDSNIRGNAPIVVMTAEILRNMIYRQEPDGPGRLDDLLWVVLDEVHYIQDEQRGPVWEEILIGCPQHVKMVCLSATISNAEQMGAWLRTVRGDVEVVVEKTRPVPLTGFQVVEDIARKKHQQILVTPLQDSDGDINLEGIRYDSSETLGDDDGWDDGLVDYSDDDDDDDENALYYYRPPWRFHTPEVQDVVDALVKRDMLPAIYFMFSRDGCDSAAWAIHQTKSLTNDDEAEQISKLAERRFATLSDVEKDALETELWVPLIASGVSPHHAGLAPVIKELVEECFTRGLLKLIFATETLSVGMNMPAKTTVLDKLSKFDGTEHKDLTPLQFKQFTGRAGRRGVDDSGYVVCIWSKYNGFEDTAALAMAESSPLESSFSPSYNSVANLASRYTRDEAQEFVSKSFAQYLANNAGEHKETRTALRSLLPHDYEQMRLPNMVDALASVMIKRGHLDDQWNLTTSGQVLACITHEYDLLVAEAITVGIFDDLSAIDLAAVVSTIAYQARRDDPNTGFHLSQQVDAAVGRLYEMCRDIEEDEETAILFYYRGFDNYLYVPTGFAPHLITWMETGDLAQAVELAFSAGDFIRHSRRTVDLLKQIASVTPGTATAMAANEAARLILRGMVADTAMLALDASQ